eukprot:PhF_6_TR5732/c0_g1_i1/m.8447/K07152/SCO1_2; protein SCO1/2
MLRYHRCLVPVLTSAKQSYPAKAPLFLFSHRYASRGSPGDRDDMEIYDPQKAAAQRRGYTVFTLQEYVDKEDQDVSAVKKIMHTVDAKTDNPMWMLYALGFVGVIVGCIILSHRYRTEVRRFDPRMRELKTLDMPGGPMIGGPFELTDTNGKRVRDTDFRGKFLYIYFGFSNCPDICPAEMDKLTRMTTALDRKIGKDKWQPLFITVDPQRDTPKVLKEYLTDFHPRIIGLTGTLEEIERVARAYRVYFSIPDESNPKDYLVDHSIIMYLMSPEGKFVDYTTKDFNWHEMLAKCLRRILDYDKEKEKKAQEATGASPSPPSSGKK